MLPSRDIDAWRAHAPWPSEAQTEQDLLITRAMVAIFSDPFLAAQVAMRGGTVLHKVHLAPPARYSEDIDLVAVGDRPPTHIRRALLRVLRPILGDPPVDVIESVRLAVRNIAAPSQIIRLVYTYRPTAVVPPTAKLKIEVNVTERTPVFPLARLAFAPPLPEGGAAVFIVSYDVDEMLGTKMRALLQRDFGRDLFDLAHAWSCCTRHALDTAPALAPGASAAAATSPPQHSIITPSRVAYAFGEYMRREGAVVTSEQYGHDLDRKLTLARFRADLTDVLAAGIDYDAVAAAAVVRASYLPYLPGGPAAASSGP